MVVLLTKISKSCERNNTSMVEEKIVMDILQRVCLKSQNRDED